LKPIYPLFDRPTPVLDVIRGRIESTASPDLLEQWRRAYGAELAGFGVKLAERWMEAMRE